MGAPFSEYLAGPLRNFFLGQSLVEQGKPWPYGAWAHGLEGKREYYRERFGATSDAAIRRYLEVLGWPNQKGRVNCPCGSRRRLSKCCRAKVDELRKTISRQTARDAFHRLGFHRRADFRQGTQRRRS